MRVLVLGANGMIGSAMYRVLAERPDWKVMGTVRSAATREFFVPQLQSGLLTEVELLDQDSLVRAFAKARPKVVINCAGITKHLQAGAIPTAAIAMNALLPHRLAELCRLVGARLIHVSTDCVFKGDRGNYGEDWAPDAVDLYGRSKILGEVAGDGLLTLRTSTIGHEFNSAHGLLEWFLSQVRCKGFSQAMFSGLPSVVFAAVVRDHVIPNLGLSGLYHVGGPAINKYELLRLIAKVYKKDTEIILDAEFRMDRTLDSSRFSVATGFVAPDWAQLVELMHANR